MNSTEARMRRIQKRAGELRRKKRRLRACALTAGCMAILIALGAAMPSISAQSVRQETGAASILGAHESLVMVAASVWSLLIPAIEQSSSMGALAFLLGVCVTVLLYRIRQSDERRK